MTAFFLNLKQPYLQKGGRGGLRGTRGGLVGDLGGGNAVNISQPDLRVHVSPRGEGVGRREEYMSQG